MANPRRSDAEKKLRGTFRPERGESVLTRGRHRLEVELPPPDDLDAEAKREWSIHMHLCVTAGTINSTNLRSFISLAQSAAAAQQAYRLAMRTGPLARTKDGAKVSPAWKAYLETDAIYQRWTRQFGLTPQSAKDLPQLPALGGQLRVIDGDA